MASWSHQRGPNLYDTNWRPRIGLATSVLLKVQDAWLVRDLKIDATGLTAVVFHIFAADQDRFGQISSVGDLRSRSAEEWIGSVKSAAIECSQLLDFKTAAECAQISDSVIVIMAEAIELWKTNALDPGCEDVVHAIVTFLSEGGHVRLAR